MRLLKTISDRVCPNPDKLPVILELDLAKGVITQQPSSPLAAIKQRHATTLRDIRAALASAEDDDHVAALVVHIGVAPLPHGDADEVAQAIREFAKPTIAWSETFGELAGHTVAYRLACAADEIWLQPTGSVGFTGYHTSMALFRGVLENVGIEPDFRQRKEYKAAAETYGAQEISDANREQTQRVADSLLERAVDDVARARGLEAATVRDLVDQAPVAAEDALEQGLVDHLGYRDEVFTALRERFGTDDDIHLTYVNRYAQRQNNTKRIAQLVRGDRPTIAVVTATGPIVLGPTTPAVGQTPCGCDTLAGYLRQARHDESVAAVVLRVDSPGGSAVGSDQIRREILALREAGKTVVASMANVAASGGYFISMAADAIVANPSTLTGSIGVLGGKFVLDGLYDKLGYVTEPADAGTRAGMWSGRPFTEDEIAVLDRWLDAVYADFTTKAAHDRGMSLEELEAVARGRVWTGADALDRGLVDHLGGMRTALSVAAERVGTPLADLAVQSFPIMPWLDQLTGAESSETHASMSGFELGLDGLYAAAAREIGLTVDGPLSLPVPITRTVMGPRLRTGQW